MDIKVAGMVIFLIIQFSGQNFWPFAVNISLKNDYLNNI